MTFDHRELRAFLAISDAGSLGRAATACHMTQPALSRLIQQMELRLGQQLFDRHTKGMSPTAAGELLAPYARSVLHELGEAADALGELQGLRRGTVRIGAVATVARAILPKAAKELFAAAPGIRIELMEAPDDQLAHALLAREIDLIVAAALPAHTDIVAIAECSYNDVYTVFCHPDHPLTKGLNSLDEALGYAWIMPGPGTTPRMLFDAVIANAGKSPPEVAVEVSSPDAIATFVANTQLLGWLPQPLLLHALDSGAVVTLSLEALAIRRRFFVHRRRRGSLPAAAQRMLTMLPLAS